MDHFALNSSQYHYHDVLAHRQKIFHLALENNRIDPLVWPVDTWHLGLIFLAVLFIPRLDSYSLHRSQHWGPSRAYKHSRWIIIGLIYGLVIYGSVDVMLRCRTVGLASGYGIGLMSVWGLVWSAVLLVYNDVGTDFKRLERRTRTEVEKKTGKDTKAREEGDGDGNEDGDVYRVKGAVNRAANGIGENVAASSVKNSSTDTTTSSMNKLSMRRRDVKPSSDVIEVGREPIVNRVGSQADGQFPLPDCVLVWQGYPHRSFWHSLEWTTDLCTSFRGPGWYWPTQTHPHVEYADGHSGIAMASEESKRSLRHNALRDFVIFYLLTDVVSLVVKIDPYFCGLASIDEPLLLSPIAGPVNIIFSSSIIVRIYRLLVSMFGILSVLCLIFSLCPLFFAVLLPMCRWDRFIQAPIQEPILYPSYWGSFTANVLDKGLAGWWGGFWHQLFRKGISEPSSVLIAKLALDPKSQKANVVQLMMAFTISGFIHTAGSYTSYYPVARSPFSPFVFFVLQGVGIIAERLIFNALGIAKFTKYWPWFVRRTGTLIYVLVWLYLTGPFQTDDFAKSGVWLVEPIPVSILRGLGLGGGLDGSWWCWHGPWVLWWGGRPDISWWRKGFAIV